MLEIDGVRTVIERCPNWEAADDLSDAYLELIELATRSVLTDEVLGSIRRRRQLLQENDPLIRAQFEEHEDWPCFGGVTAAYDSTLAQIDDLSGQQG